VTSHVNGLTPDKEPRGVIPLGRLPSVWETATYANLGTQFIFQPITVESPGPMHESARRFPVDLGHKITAHSGDDRKGSFFISVHCSFVARQFCFCYCPDWMVTPFSVLYMYLIFLHTFDIFQGLKNNSNNNNNN